MKFYASLYRLILDEPSKFMYVSDEVVNDPINTLKQINVDFRESIVSFTAHIYNLPSNHSQIFPICFKLNFLNSQSFTLISKMSAFEYFANLIYYVFTEHIIHNLPFNPQVLKSVMLHRILFSKSFLVCPFSINSLVCFDLCWKHLYLSEIYNFEISLFFTPVVDTTTPLITLPFWQPEIMPIAPVALGSSVLFECLHY